MSPFLLNILLALIWAAAMGDLSVASLAAGFVIGYIALMFVRQRLNSPSYFTKVPLALGLILNFVWDLIRSSIRVAYDVITPHNRRKMRPGIFCVPLSAKSDVEIAVLANLISATPGTLSLDVSDDRGVLYIHAMYLNDVEELRADIKNGFERRLLELAR